ncbi:MAG TPA: hypothetical protein VFC34_16775 [Puia sp.]|nr:hypothetical protein [Puia sp.]
MSPEIIEIFVHKGEGYNPFFIRDHWQVAQLNHIVAQDLWQIEKMDMHRETDEIFILTKGTAVLIAGEAEKEGFLFQCIGMQVGITYNIPANAWHNIAMDKEAEIIIVEKSNTHLDDFVYQLLTDKEKQELNVRILAAIKGI